MEYGTWCIVLNLKDNIQQVVFGKVIILVHFVHKFQYQITQIEEKIYTFLNKYLTPIS